MGPRHRPPVLLVLLLVAAALCLLVAASASILLWTSWGHAQLCRLLNRAVTGQIAGRLEVDSIEELSLTRVKVRGVKIFPPTGPAAIEADSALIDFSPRKLWAGEYGWQRAEISHCMVRVTEDAAHKINMEETFKGRPGPDDLDEPPKSEQTKDILDLQSMVTSDCTLHISGGSLSTLHLTKLAGIMRVHVLGNGDTELRFDRYKGTFAAGLPTGVLEFHDVVGDVTTAGKRLLRFDGLGRTRGSDVAFELDIATKPKQLVKIDAVFPTLSAAALRTECVSLWTKFSDSIELNVHLDKRASAQKQ